MMDTRLAIPGPLFVIQHAVCILHGSDICVYWNVDGRFLFLYFSEFPLRALPTLKCGLLSDFPKKTNLSQLYQNFRSLCRILLTR